MSLRFAALRPAAARNGIFFQLTRHLSSLALLVSDRTGLFPAAPCGAVRSWVVDSENGICILVKSAVVRDFGKDTEKQKHLPQIFGDGRR